MERSLERKRSLYLESTSFLLCVRLLATMRKWVSAIQATAAKTSRRVRVDFKQDGGIGNGIGYS